MSENKDYPGIRAAISLLTGDESRPDPDADRVEVVRDLVYPPGIAPEIIDNAPFTPVSMDNTGRVRDKNGHCVANCDGNKAMAQSIALLFNEEASKARAKLLARLMGYKI